MKFLYFFTAVIFVLHKASGQSLPIRQMDSKLIGKDSVVMYYDMHYRIIESGCATMIRYGHYDHLHSHFIGKFKDVNKSDTSYIISEGSYSDDGKKNGEFIIHDLTKVLRAKGYFEKNNYQREWFFYYPNGKLEEKSNFENGQYAGRREFYYEDGSPNIFMKITNDKFEITDMWATDGKKVIDKGCGDFMFFDGALTWQGRLLDGIPDGLWTFRVSDDIYGSEVFKSGRFIKGVSKNMFGRKIYRDRSRIRFAVHTPTLAISNADEFQVAGNISCGGTDYSKYARWQTFFFKP